VLRFFHEQLNFAVSNRYLQTESGRQERHRQLALLFLSKADPRHNRTWTGRYPRGFAELPYHDYRAGMIANLEAELLDFGFLRAKSAAVGIELLLEDYCFTDSKLTEVQKQTLGLVQRALRSSAHTSYDPAQLSGQLIGRLSTTDNQQIKTLLTQAHSWKGEPWLRPLHPNLTPAGGHLLRNLVNGSEVFAACISSDGKRALSGSQRGDLRLWDLDAGMELREFAAGQSPISGVAGTADLRRAVSSSRDGAIRLWDVEDGNLLLERMAHPPQGLTRCAISADGRRGTTLGSNGLHIWDFERGVVLHEIPSGLLSSATPGCVAISDDGTHALASWGSVSGKIGIWEVDSGTPIGSFDVLGSNFAVSSEGRFLVAISADRKPTIWDLRTRASISILEGTSGPVTPFAISRDGTRVLLEQRYDVLAWDVPSASLVKLTRLPISCRSLSLDDHWHRAISTGGVDQTLKVYDLAQGTYEAGPSGHGYYVISVALTADGQNAISAGWDGNGKIWEVETGRELFNLPGAHRASISPDGRLVIGGQHVWDARTGRIIQTLKEGIEGECYGLSGDGRTALLVHHSNACLAVLNVGFGSVFELEKAHLEAITCAALSLDGLWAVSGSWDKTVVIWNLQHRRKERVLSGHTGAVTSVALTADGQTVVSGSRDGTAKLWSTSAGAEIATLAHGNVVEGVALTPWGTRVATVSQNGLLYVWDIRTHKWIAGFTADGDFTTCAIASDGLIIVAGGRPGFVHFLKLEHYDATAGP
jgi:WD40 repeat protein